jgi:ribosomal protein S4
VTDFGKRNRVRIQGTKPLSGNEFFKYFIQRNKQKKQTEGTRISEKVAELRKHDHEKQKLRIQKPNSFPMKP